MLKECVAENNITYIDCEERALLLDFRPGEIDHHIATALPAEQMRFALLSEKVRFKLRLRVVDELHVAALGVKEQVTWGSTSASRKPFVPLYDSEHMRAPDMLAVRTVLCANRAVASIHFGRAFGRQCVFEREGEADCAAVAVCFVGLGRHLVAFSLGICGCCTQISACCAACGLT